MGDCCGNDQVDTQSCCSRGDGCCKVDNGANTSVAVHNTNNTKKNTIDGAFEDLFFLEESIINKGMEEGIEAGKRAGFQDAYNMGYTNGKEIGKEIGFYHGHVIGWKALMEKHPDLFSNRGHKTVKKLEDLIKACTLSTANENLQQQLEDIRTAFKLASSQLRSLYKKEDALDF
eukprot:Phypoly_transcript_16801.p1 GENE.Phypoly_transcript_16801~~Phypoly_transcript_16801.p1  ORF type:complete len:174 (+),score=33.95 Phypoly_transcript_16801:163-684(+)